MDERALCLFRDTAATNSCRLEQPGLVYENDCYGELLRG
jgi:hypothetical protein